MVTSLHERAIYSGAKAQNAEWGASDCVGVEQDGKTERCIFQVLVSVTDAVIEFTLDSGTTWGKINNGTAIPVGKFHQFDVYIPGGASFNVRASNASGTTVDEAKLVSSTLG